MTPPDRRRRYAVSAAAVWLIAALAYLILEAVAAADYRPHYSYADDFVSDLGVTFRGLTSSPLAYLMNTAFLVQGTLFFLGAVLIVAAGEIRRAGLFLGLAAANAVGNIMVAAIHSGPIAHADGTIWIHQTGALLAIVGGNAAILVGSSVVADSGGPPWCRRIPVALAGLGLLSFALLVLESNLPAIRILPPAVWERASVYPIIAGQTVIAAHLLIHRR